MKAGVLLWWLDISYFCRETAVKISVGNYLPLRFAAPELKLHVVSNCSTLISVFFIIFLTFFSFELNFVSLFIGGIIIYGH